MARTIRSIILGITNEQGDNWISPGEIFRKAQEKGYKGSQQRLLLGAGNLVEEEVLESHRRGRGQKHWYRISQSQSSNIKGLGPTHNVIAKEMDDHYKDKHPDHEL